MKKRKSMHERERRENKTIEERREELYRKSGKIRNVIIVLLLLVYAVGSLAVQQFEISKKENQIAELRTKREKAEAKNKELKKDLKSIGSLEYIEKKARENGLLKEDEKVFIDADK